MTAPLSIEGILQESERLRSEVPEARSQTSPEVVKLKIAERKRFCIRLRELKASLRQQVSALSIEEQKHGVDITELDELKWELLRDEKASRSPHGVQPGDQ